MTGRRLSAEQAELIHHVELADAGWPDRLWEQLVLSTALTSAANFTEDELIPRLGQIGIPPSAKDAVQKAVRRLVGKRSLLEVTVGHFSPSQTALSEAEQHRASARDIESEAKRIFDELVAAESSLAQEPIEWSWFCDECLTPLVSILGARTHELLAANQGNETANRLTEYLDAVPASKKAGVTKVVEGFFSSKNAKVRAFVLRSLHSHLLCLAASLPLASLSALQEKAKANLHLKIFLDTNFLFSILGLHENPSNDAAAELLGLVSQLNQRIRVSLHVTGLTVDEVRRTLSFYQTKLSELAITPKLGSVASNLDGDFSGITLKYFEAVKNAKHRLSAKDYLGPYLENLVTVLRGRNIELYNENTDQLSQSQPVIDDILAEEQRDEKRRPDRGKSYEALRHDVTLWHLTHKLRPQRLDSPLDASFWIATVDYRFLGFDNRKRRTQKDPIPVCVHPTVLIQMLQFWLPRSAEFESALFESLKAALPHHVDADAEEMSLRIIKALARFENVDDLPADTITSVLVNSALRQRMGTVQDKDKEQEFVKEAIVEEVSAAKTELEKERKAAKELRGALERTLGEKESAEVAARKVDAARQGEVAQLQAQLDQERGRVADVTRKLEQLEQWAQGEEHRQLALVETAKARKSRSWFVVAMIVSLAVFLGLAWFVSRGWSAVPPQGWKREVASSLTATAVWMTLILQAGQRWSSVPEWGLFAHMKNAIFWTASTAWGLALSIFGSWLWEVING